MEAKLHTQNLASTQNAKKKRNLSPKLGVCESRAQILPISLNTKNNALTMICSSSLVCRHWSLGHSSSPVPATGAGRPTASLTRKCMSCNALGLEAAPVTAQGRGRAWQ